jgi:HD-like signal output (HDOD) protein
LLDRPPGERPPLSNEAVALERMLELQFSGHDLSLPPLPQVPERVLRRLRDRHCDFTKVADDIAEDPVVSAAVIRTANSPLFRGLAKITALPTAVGRLGSNTLRTIMFHQSMRAMTVGAGGTDRALARLVWQRSLANGAVTRCLATFADVDPEEACLIGLLADIGDVIVLREAQKLENALRYELNQPAFDYFCAKYHEPFGRMVADEWDLPPRLRHLIGDHHQPPASDDRHRDERLLLQVSDIVCSLLGYTLRRPYDLLASRPVRDLGLADRADFIAALERMPDEINAMIACL